MNKRYLLRYLAFFVFLLCGWMGPVRADIYAYTDENGVINYTNIPSNDKRLKLIKKTRGPSQVSVVYAAPALPPRRVLQTQYAHIVSQVAREFDVDEALVRAVIHVESAYNPYAISPKGAYGLMQLMPGTAQRYGVKNLFDPTENVRGGVRYLRDLMQKFGNNLDLTLAAYNAGENAVLRYNGIPPYPETTSYVLKVLDLHSRYRDAIHG